MSTINPYEAPQSGLSSIAHQQETEEQLRPLLDAFVFQNTDYYAKFYPGVLQGHKSLGFNWAAAIFPTPWLAYRRMYAWVAVYMATTAIFSVLLVLALAQLPASGTVYGSITAAWMIGLRYAAGKLANYLYLSSALKKINKITASQKHAEDPEEMRNSIELAGGTSGLACTLVIVFSGVVNMISSQM
ncbi:MAG: DUF2628 domain-containing protein [Pseudomonadota bacterium]